MDLHVGLQSNSKYLYSDDIVIINLHMRRLLRTTKWRKKEDMRLVLMDASYMGFNDNSFENVYAGKVIHWLNSEEEVLSMITEMVRVAEKKVEFTVIDFGSDIYLREKYGLCLATSTWRSHPESIQGLFTEERLPIILEELDIYNYKIELLDMMEDTNNDQIIKATREYTVAFDPETMKKKFVKFDKPLPFIIKVTINK